MLIKIIGACDGTPTPFDGQYIQEYDPHVPGIGPNGEPLIMHLLTTDDPAKGRNFERLDEALEYWRQSHGWRPWDGKPNRPLTYFTITFEDSRKESNGQ